MLYIAPIYSLFSPEHKYQEYDTFYTLFFYSCIELFEPEISNVLSVTFALDLTFSN